MTEVVINQNDGFVSITASGGEVNLDFDFPIYEKAHLRIIRTRASVDTDLELDTDYTIATDQLELTAGGRAVLVTPATAADVYTLLLNTPEERTTDFNEAGDFFASTLNRELDLQTQQIQALRRDIDKSARLPDSSTITSLSLPSPSASTLVGWNAAADALENYTPNTGAYLNVSAFMETVLDDADAATALATLGAQEDLSGASLTSVTAAPDDKILIQDTDDSGNLKTVALSSVSLTNLGAAVQLSANESIANSTNTNIPWDAEDYDTSSLWVIGSPTRFTIPSGWTKVLVSAGVAFAADTTGRRLMEIIKNGADFQGMPSMNVSAANSGATNLSVSAVVTVSATDYLEVRVNQTSGGALNVLDNDRTFFTITRLA